MKTQTEATVTTEAIPTTFQNWREYRRFQAWELKQQGWSQTRIAEALGVTDGAVSHWFKSVREAGVSALRSRRGGGPKPGLSAAELQQLPALLKRGAEAYGFRGAVWTRARVGQVIRQKFGVAYSDSHVGRLLAQIGWTLQKPAEQADRRDEAKITKWGAETFPELKKKPLTRNAPSCL